MILSNGNYLSLPNSFDRLDLLNRNQDSLGKPVLNSSKLKQSLTKLETIFRSKSTSHREDSAGVVARKSQGWRLSFRRKKEDNGRSLSLLIPKSSSFKSKFSYSSKSHCKNMRTCSESAASSTTYKSMTPIVVNKSLSANQYRPPNKDDIDSGLCSAEENLKRSNESNEVNQPASRHFEFDKSTNLATSPALNPVVKKPTTTIAKSKKGWSIKRAALSKSIKVDDAHKHNQKLNEDSKHKSRFEFEDGEPESKSQSICYELNETKPGVLSTTPRRINRHVPVNIKINECEEADSYELTPKSSKLTSSSTNQADTLNSSTFTLNNQLVMNAASLSASAGQLTVNSPTAVSSSIQTSILASLEYLINRSKSNQLTFNTKLAIASIAAAISAENTSPETNDTSDFAETSFSNVNSSGLYSLAAPNDHVLQSLLVDLMSPPTATAPSHFELNSTASNEALHYANDLVLLQHIPPNNKLLNNNEAIENLTQQMISNVAGEMNTNTKQINDQIMRTCMGYLDYVNKKHNKERHIQKVRNKISGFVLLTLVFLMIFSLGLVMSVFLTKAIVTTAIMESMNSTENPSSTPTAQNPPHSSHQKIILVDQDVVQNVSSNNRVALSNREWLEKQEGLKQIVEEDLSEFIQKLFKSTSINEDKQPGYEDRQLENESKQLYASVYNILAAHFNLTKIDQNDLANIDIDKPDQDINSFFHV